MDSLKPVLRFSLLLILLLVFSCKDALEYNPLDPDNNPDYVAPETFLTMDGLEGSVLDTSTVTVTWQGNDLVTEYSYSLNDNWSEWLADTSVTLNYLDEGDYTFSVKGRYASGDEDETPATVSFTVDAIQGPALIFYPRRHIISSGSTATFQIKAHEVENLMLATINIAYDNTLIEILSVNQGDMFIGSGESVFIDEKSTNSLSIYTMLLGGDSPSISGTGVLAEITVKSMGTSTLSLDGTQIFKTHEDIPISILETVNGLVVVQ